MSIVDLRELLVASQRRWADDLGYSYDTKGRLRNLATNLLQPMAQDTLAEFVRGSGGELRAGRLGGQPKMHSLHSSSVLAINVFDYWRLNGVGFIRQAMRVEPPIDRLTFETKFPTGLPGEPPNLDVVLWLLSGEIWGIESKFTEPFGRQKSSCGFKEKYFPAGRPIWSHYCLNKCATLAAALQNGTKAFRHLDAAQLLKHALGLHVNHSGRFTLCYVYVDHDSLEAERHRDEIADFGAAVAGDFPFVSLSYTTLLRRLRDCTGSDHQAYFAYIARRYGFGLA